MKKQSLQPTLTSLRTVSVLLVALGLIVQSLLVQTHLHGIDGKIGSVVPAAVEITASLNPDDGHKPSQCLLCEEQAMAGHYTSPPPVWHLDDDPPVFQLDAVPPLVAAPRRRDLPSRHPRGPPTSTP